jgi:hypothetical protein
MSEIWNRVHACGFCPAFGASGRALVGRLIMGTAGTNLSTTFSKVAAKL